MCCLIRCAVRSFLTWGFSRRRAERAAGRARLPLRSRRPGPLRCASRSRELAIAETGPCPASELYYSAGVHGIRLRRWAIAVGSGLGAYPSPATNPTAPVTNNLLWFVLVVFVLLPALFTSETWPFPVDLQKTL